MRLHIHVGLIDDPKPEDREPVELQAAADESQTGTVGRWFSANLNLSTALALVTTGVTIIGGWYSLQIGQARHDTQIAGNAASIRELKQENAAAIKALSDKFDAKVVSREEYQNHKRDEATEIAAVRDQVQQLYTVTLTGALINQAKGKP